MKKGFLFLLMLMLAASMFLGCDGSSSSSSKSVDPELEGVWKFTKELYDGVDVTIPNEATYLYIYKTSSLTFTIETNGSETAHFDDLSQIRKSGDKKISLKGADYKMEAGYEIAGTTLTMNGTLTEDGQASVDAEVTAEKVVDEELPNTWQIIAQTWKGELEKFPEQPGDGDHWDFKDHYIQFAAKMTGYEKTDGARVYYDPDFKNKPYEVAGNQIKVDFEENGVYVNFATYRISGNLIYIKIDKALVGDDMPEDIYAVKVPESEVAGAQDPTP